MSDQKRTRREDRIIAAVCRQLELPIEQLESRVRTPEVVVARQLTCYVLQRAGYSVAEVGRRMGRDHSTVLYALRRVTANPALAEQGQEIAESVLPFIGEEEDEWPRYRLPAEALPRTLLRALLGLGTLQEVRAVRAYVLGPLLGRERTAPVHAAWGLWLLGRRPALRAAVDDVLGACGLGAYCGLIGLQLTRMGLAAG